ncbi:hypothetical protein EBB07_11285 [Paenibacillaceae bacterium]|nr:hypothetical protein EBB07_11285 [Paenibacillaceae bacterium]
MNNAIVWDERLSIAIPVLERDWEEYSVSEREAIVERWELIRGSIPARVFLLEQEINRKQTELFNEDDFGRSCQINSEIAELASQINDLLIWYRVDQEIEPRRHR